MLICRVIKILLLPKIQWNAKWACMRQAVKKLMRVIEGPEGNLYTVLLFGLIKKCISLKKRTSLFSTSQPTSNNSRLEGRIDEEEKWLWGLQMSSKLWVESVDSIHRLVFSIHLFVSFCVILDNILCIIADFSSKIKMLAGVLIKLIDVGFHSLFSKLAVVWFSLSFLKN